MSFKLRCLKCSKIHEDHYTLVCDNGCDSLLRAEYDRKRFNRSLGWPMFTSVKYWLPENTPIVSEPIVYKSSILNKALGLPNLYISFSGYWPEKFADTLTCSFKEYEAFSTLQRVKDTGGTSLVLASAGNTGRAFAYASKIMDVPVTIVIPRKYLFRLWVPEEAGESVKVICVDGDYLDAIKMAEQITKTSPLLRNEGGAKNTARRDGMGMVMLRAVDYIGRIPDHYFQAIGSGTGAIATWEASLRLIEDGRFGTKLPKLQLSQNSPFVPMYDAFNKNERKISTSDNDKELIDTMYANVLSNRSPCYSITGGIYDAMNKCGGNMYSVTNEEAKAAQLVFETIEKIDILPAAAVAVASLLKAINEKKVEKKDYILLNITGGGEERLKRDRKIFQL